MAYSILTEPWLNVRMKDDSIRCIAPWQVADPDVVDIVHSRPDLNGAARELVIGLLQVIYPPATVEDKLDCIGEAPALDVLRSAFESKAHLFELIEGPSRFLQEHGGVPAEEIRPLENLLLNGPGEHTRKMNKDFFVRTGLTDRACPSCVVHMLAAKQFYASGTGPGFRVSPRGGGPMTTLMEFTDPSGNPLSLWQSLYANVMPLSGFGVNGLTESNQSRILPWLAPIRVSKTGRADVTTTLADAHPFQVFFPMSSRIEVVWEDAGSECRCDVCGAAASLVATGWKTAQYGVMYSGIEHPLTPYRVTKDNARISLKPKLSGISYPDWMAITIGSEDNTTPARNIQDMKEFVHDIGLPVRIRAFGYQLDNASALAWHESVLPFIEVPAELRKDFAAEVGLMVSASREFSSALVSHVRQALYDRPKNVSGDMSHIQREFVSTTTSEFYDKLPEVLDAIRTGRIPEIKKDWLSTIKSEALKLFHRHAPLQVVEERNLKRMVDSYRKFENLLESDWALGLLKLPLVEKTDRKKKARQKQEEVV